jgi:ABC-type sugar transport system substrate-binding protein
MKSSLMPPLLGALGALSLVLLPGTGGALADGKKVAFFDAGPTHPYVAAMNKAFNARAKELGLEVTQFDTPYDAALQSQQIEDAVSRKFDLLAVMGASVSAIVPALTRAKQAGIPVVIVNNGIKAGVEDLYVTEVTDDTAKVGRLAAEATIRAVKESDRTNAKVALITGSLTEGVAKVRLDAFNGIIKEHPEIKVVATEDAYWDAAKSESIAAQLFARFQPQGGLDVIIGWADNQTDGIIHAAEAAQIPLGVGKGKLTVIGTNCTPQTEENIRSGKQYASASEPPVRMGSRSAEAVADVLAGKPQPKHIVLDVDPITKGNFDKYVAGCTY